MKRIFVIILSALLLLGCSESVYDATRVPSLNKRYLHIGTSSIDFPSSSSTQSMMIEAEDTPWKISVPASWVNVNRTSGNNSEFVGFSVEANNSADTSRVCMANVMADVPDWERSYAITLTQAKANPYITLAESSLTIDGAAQKKKIPVSTNTKYEVLASAEWLKVINHGYDGIEISIEENTTGNARTAQVSLSAKGINSVLTVVQRAANITTTVESLEFTYEASSATIVVDAEASWQAVASDWIGLSQTSGKAGKSTLTIEVPKNASAKSRNGFVYLTIDSTNRVEIPVLQGCIAFDVSVSTIDFDSFGGMNSFEVTSNDSWEVTSCPEWIELSSKSGSGNAKIDVTAKENNTTTNLSGKIELATTDHVITCTISVSQSAKHIDFDVPSISFTYAEGDKTFSFETDGAWSATTDADWFTIDKKSGNGNSTITVHVQENMTLSDRSGEVHLTIAGQPYAVNVYQGSKYLTLSSSAFTFDASSGYTTISISSNTDWNTKVVKGEDWISVSPSKATNNEAITLYVSENNTIYNREGEIQIEIPGVMTYIINIVQNRKYLKTDVSSVDFTSDGGTLTFNVTSDADFKVSRIGSWFGFTRNGNLITVVAQQNTTGQKRTGTLIITLTGLVGGDYSIVLPVMQLE